MASRAAVPGAAVPAPILDVDSESDLPVPSSVVNASIVQSHAARSYSHWSGVRNIFSAQALFADGAFHMQPLIQSAAMPSQPGAVVPGAVVEAENDDPFPTRAIVGLACVMLSNARLWGALPT